MPSLAIPLSLILAAAAASPPSGGRDASAAPAPTAKPAAARPADANGPKPPATPAGGKPASKSSGEAATVDEPEEEVVADSKSKAREHRRTLRRAAGTDQPDVPDRKITWPADRYAAVVPPGLTLAALRSQLAKAQAAPVDDGRGAAADDGPSGTLADIEKAREALRQETARLEALLKTAGNCGAGPGIAMPIGDGLSGTTPVSPMALREAPAEQIDSVSKAMKGMKPEQAAAVVARLDRGLAAEILRRMKAADAGAVLGLLRPELAAELATQIATRKVASGKEKKGPGR